MRTDEHLQGFFRPWISIRGGVALEIAKSLGIRGRAGVQNSEAKETATAVMLADLYYRHTIAISHKLSYYSQFNRRYIPSWHTASNVLFAENELLEAGLIIRLDGVHGIASGVVFASGKLLSLFDDGEAPVVQEKELVQMRVGTKKNKKPAPVPSNAFTRGRKRDLADLNAWSSEANFSFNPYISLQSQLQTHPLNTPSPPYGKDTLNTLGTIGYSDISRPLCNSVHTVFNNDLNRGGRLYTSAGVQNIRRSERKSVTINGEQTVEPDFRGFHLCMLYAMVGIQYDEDGYLAVCEELGGEDDLRPLIKLCFNTAINAMKNEYSGGVLTRIMELCKSKDPDKVMEGRDLWNALEDYNLSPNKILETFMTVHAPIAHYLATGIGAELQKVDGQIALETRLGLMEDGIHSAGVHDSVIVAEQHQTKTVDAMHEAYSRNMNGFTAVIDIGE